MHAISDHFTSPGADKSGQLLREVNCTKLLTSSFDTSSDYFYSRYIGCYYYRITLLVHQTKVVVSDLFCSPDTLAEGFRTL